MYVRNPIAVNNDCYGVAEEWSARRQRYLCVIVSDRNTGVSHEDSI